jgi:thymidylate kinase
MRAPPTGAVGAYPSDTIPALATLLTAFADEGLHYCVWKGSIRAGEALGGRADLDMLVAPEQAGAFREIVGGHGLKRILAGKGSTQHGIEHFLGMDRGTGQLFHLHVYYQLLLGDRLAWNLRLPLEREVLRSIRVPEGVPVPHPALELSIVCIRTLLKYRTRDAVKDLLGTRSPGISRQSRNEIEWLLDQTSVEEVRDVLASSGQPSLVRPVVRFLATFPQAPRSALAWLRLRSELRNTLGREQRWSLPRATIAYWGGVWRRRTRLGRRFPKPRMTPASGGVTIALVGADGSGKTTVAAALASWLSWKLDVRVYYLGSKSPSPTSRALAVGFRALRRAHRELHRRGGLASRAARPLASLRDTVLALRYLAIGRDRVRRHRAGRRDARAGKVVIFDRFPLEAVSTSDHHRTLDGPKISRTLAAGLGPVNRALARAEERMYRGIAVPDHLIVLGVSPEVSADRKPDHAFDVVEAKSRAAAELATLAERGKEPVSVIRVDANRPLEGVLLEVKTAVWDVL